MDKAKANRLTALIWQDRFRLAIPFALFVVLGAGIAAFIILDEKISDRAVVHAQVDGWSRTQSDTGSSTYVIWVTLEDGSKVAVTAGRDGRAPKIGERIEVVKMRTAIGGVRYEWTR